MVTKSLSKDKGGLTIRYPSPFDKLFDEGRGKYRFPRRAGLGPPRNTRKTMDKYTSIPHKPPANTAHPAFQSDGTHRSHILLHMDYALQPHLYKNVPVYLWPWVWWQLFQIECWIKQTGRMVLGGVARDGKVYVLHVADDPNAPKPWSPKDLKLLKCRHQDWIAALSPVHGLAQPDRNPLSRVRRRRLARVRLKPLSQAFAYNPTRHGDQLLLAMHLLEWPLMTTPVGCNEPMRIAPPALAQPPPLSPPALSPSGTRGKQVPVWLRQPMNQAEGSAATSTNGPERRTALSPVHVRAKPDTEPASRSVAQSALALRKIKAA